MFAYRHAFHAGNHADVLKHCVVQQILKYLNLKDKPYWAIDTHAGSGMYSLESEFASTKAEYRSGIAKLWQATDLPEVLAEYVQLIRHVNERLGQGENQLTLYPGSPHIIRAMLRADDRLRAFELHPSDYPLLENLFARDRQVKTWCSDGFASLKALLPPPPRRAFILMDPPYEMKTDYQQVVLSVLQGCQKFPEGIYAIWYPILLRQDYQRMLETLVKQLPHHAGKLLNISLTLHPPQEDGFGLLGSGLLIVNPPWTLADTMKPVMPYLVGALGSYQGASYEINSL